MRLDTFEKKVKELVAATGMPTNELALNVDPYGKKVTVKIYGENGFCVADKDLNECYAKAVRVLAAYGPKRTRAKKVKAEKAD